MRVLVADDEPLLRIVMAETLKDAGFEVIEAKDGTEACQMVIDPDHMDLIVTDLNMPGFDGVAVANWARARHPEVPVIFVSGRPDLLTAALPPVPHRRLTKPFRMEELARMARELVAA